jgi:hypothetical protein
MSEQEQNIKKNTPTIQSGPQIVADFIESLKNNAALDTPTVEAIETLHKANKLNLTPLLKMLEDARGKTTV